MINNIDNFTLTTTQSQLSQPPSFCSLASSDSDCDHWSCEMSEQSCEHVIVDQIVSHDQIE